MSYMDNRRREIAACIHEWNNFSGSRQRCVKCLGIRQVVFKGHLRNLDRDTKAKVALLNAELKEVREWLKSGLPNTVDARLKRRAKQARLKELLAEIRFQKGY
jgi:hypothetical protein